MQLMSTHTGSNFAPAMCDEHYYYFRPVSVIVGYS